MKSFFLSGFLIFFVSSVGFCNFGNINKAEYQDYILLNSGEVVRGEIVKFGSTFFTIEKENGSTLKIHNEDVNLVAVSQEMTSGEKYRLGILDGKRYAKNKGGNFAIGLFFGLIGTAIVYVSSDQMPSYEAMNGSNKALVNEVDYLRGYEKGAKAKSGGKALIGTLISVGILIIVNASAGVSTM
jgi:hypothetical protein